MHGISVLLNKPCYIFYAYVCIHVYMYVCIYGYNLHVVVPKLSCGCGASL